MTKGRPLAGSNPYEFTKDWNSYIPTKVMAEKYGVSKDSIGKHARKLGLSPRLYRKKKNTDEQG